MRHNTLRGSAAVVWPQGQSHASASGTNDGEQGSIKVLTIGYLVVALLVVIVLVAITQVYLEHKKLLSLADGAAAAAADTFNLTDVAPGSNANGNIRLVPARISAASADFLSKAPGARDLHELSLQQASPSSDGASAVVTLSSVAHPPIISFLIPGGIRIEATSTAKAILIR